MRTLPRIVERGEEIEMQIFRGQRRSMSRDALREKLRPVIAEWLRAASTWGPGTMVGDYRRAAFSVPLTPKGQIVLQFWSEPGEPLVWEISAENAGARPDRIPGFERLDGLGFASDVEPGHYTREEMVENDLDIVRIAERVPDVLYAAFDYRGGEAVTASLSYETRASARFTYDSFTPEDLAKIMMACGFEVVEVGGDDELPVLRAVRRGVTTFMHLLDPVADEYLFQRAVLSAEVEVSEAHARAATELKTELEDAPSALQIGTTLIFQGGVTAVWVEQRLQEWDAMTWSTQREARRARRRPVRRKNTDRVTVH